MNRLAPSERAILRLSKPASIAAGYSASSWNRRARPCRQSSPRDDGRSARPARRRAGRPCEILGARVPICVLTTIGIAELIQKLLRRHQIGGAKTLRKLFVDRLEAGDGIG